MLAHQFPLGASKPVVTQTVLVKLPGFNTEVVYKTKVIEFFNSRISMLSFVLFVLMI